MNSRTRRPQQDAASTSNEPEPIHPGHGGAKLPAILAAAALVASLLLHASGAHGMEQSRPINADRDWCLVFGSAITWPKLASANHDILVVQRQLRSVAPHTKPLPNWSGTLTGNIGAGLQYRLPVLGGRLWLGYYFSYAEGPIGASQGPAFGLSGLSVGSRFEQVYRFTSNDLFLLLDVLTFKRVVVSAGGGVALNSFSSTTDVATYSAIPVFSTHSRSSFSSTQPGVSVQAGVDILLTDWLALNIMGRYSWCTFTGSSPVVTDVMQQGTITRQIQAKRVEVDVSGPSLGVYLKLFI